MSLAHAYGGVIFDRAGRVLLRQPTGRFDGYAWTFAKGRPDAGETPERTALRETLEETGYDAEIVAPIEGEFVGGTTVNRYFLMRPTACRPVGVDREALLLSTRSIVFRPSDIGCPGPSTRDRINRSAPVRSHPGSGPFPGINCKRSVSMFAYRPLEIPVVPGILRN